MVMNLSRLYKNLFHREPVNESTDNSNETSGWLHSAHDAASKIRLGPLRIILTYISKLSIRKKLIFILITTCLIVFLICYAVFSSINQQNIKSKIQSDLKDTYSQNSKEFQNYLNGLDNIAYTVIYSNWAQDLLSTRYANMPVEAEKTRGNINHFLSSLSSINDDIRFILFASGRVVTQNHAYLSVRYEYNVEEEPWYGDMVDSGRYILYDTPHNIYYNADQPMLMIFYPVRSNYTRQIIGCLMLSVPPRVLAGFETVYTNQYEARLTDSQGSPLIPSSGILSSFSGEGFFFAENLQGYRGPLALEGWYLEVLQTGVAGDAETPNQMLLLLMIPVILFCLVIAGFFSYYLTNPILQCKEAILAVRDNNLGVKINNTYHDEIGELIDGFNDMSKSIANLVDQNRLIYLLKRDAELEVLQQKINPHFLYNTLEILNGLILDHQDKLAVRLCENLGLMFRYNLDGRKWVSVKDECDQIQLYLTAIGFRNMDIEYDVDIDDGLEKYKMPKLVLQPIVENSIKHGLSSNTAGCLSIRVKNEEPNIRFVIMDNGVGMEKEELSALLKSIRLYDSNPEKRDEKFQSNNKLQNHMGLYNVFQRLRMEYGDLLEFKMISAKGRGTSTEFSIPRMEVKDA